MKTLHALLFALIVPLIGFGLNSCDGSERVEAARENDSVNDRRNILTDEEKDFIEYAAELHAGEIDMAQQAKQKSTNEDVRDYADSVISAHSGASKELAGSIGQNAAPTASMDTKYHMEFLSPLSGAQFEQEFINLMIADHQNASETFRLQVNAAQNKDLQNYVEKVLPTLENHLRDAQEVQRKLTAQGTKKE